MEPNETFPYTATSHARRSNSLAVAAAAAASAPVLVAGGSDQLAELSHLFGQPSTAMTATVGQSSGRGLVQQHSALECDGDEEHRKAVRVLYAGCDEPDESRRRSSTLDIFGDLTPVSVCSDWDTNTNEATKGSTTNPSDVSTNTATTEEDDEDATISTETCLSAIEPQQQQQLAESRHDNGTSARGLSCKPLETHSAFTRDEKLVKLLICTARGGAMGGPLYEKDSRTEAKNLQIANEWDRMEGRMFEAGAASAFHHSRRPTLATVAPGSSQRFHMSFDELRKELPRNERNLLSSDQLQQHPAPILRHPSSSDTTTTSPTHEEVHIPGALLIREGFIKPPRLTRVIKSFHGKTDYQQRFSFEQPDGESRGGAGDVCRCSSFAANRYNKNNIRQQQCGVHAGTSRFTTSLVPEPLVVYAPSEQTDPVAQIEPTSKTEEEESLDARLTK